MTNSTNFSIPSKNSTGFTKSDSSANSFGFVSGRNIFYLLLQASYFLFQDGSNKLILQNGFEVKPSNFTKSSVTTTNFT